MTIEPVIFIDTDNTRSLEQRVFKFFNTLLQEHPLESMGLGSTNRNVFIANCAEYMTERKTCEKERALQLKITHFFAGDGWIVGPSKVTRTGEVFRGKTGSHFTALEEAMRNARVPLEDIALSSDTFTVLKAGTYSHVPAEQAFSLASKNGQIRRRVSVMAPLASLHTTDLWS